MNELYKYRSIEINDMTIENSDTLSMGVYNRDDSQPVDFSGDFEFDIEAHVGAVVYSVALLVATLFALQITKSIIRIAWLMQTGQWEKNKRLVKDGCHGCNKLKVETMTLFIFNILFAATLFIWAWSSCKTVLGHKTASHLFGGLAIGIGISLRDFFTSAMVYFVLTTSAPFKTGDLMLIRPKYGEQYVGKVVSLGFLHTELQAVDESGKVGKSGTQFIQNQMLMSNTLCVFKNNKGGGCKFNSSWSKFGSWKRSQTLETGSLLSKLPCEHAIVGVGVTASCGKASEKETSMSEETAHLTRRTQQQRVAVRVLEGAIRF